MKIKIIAEEPFTGFPWPDSPAKESWFTPGSERGDIPDEYAQALIAKGFAAEIVAAAKPGKSKPEGDLA